MSTYIRTAEEVLAALGLTKRLSGATRVTITLTPGNLPIVSADFFIENSCGETHTSEFDLVLRDPKK